MAVSRTPLQASAVAAAHNSQHTQLAVIDTSGRLSVWQREGGSKEWTLKSSLAAEGLRITSLCFAPAQFGGVIAGGATDGSVAVWLEEPGEHGGWRLAAVLKESTLAVQDLAFGPPELGPLLAVAYADGFVRCGTDSVRGCVRMGTWGTRGCEASRPCGAALWERMVKCSLQSTGLPGAAAGSLRRWACWQPPAGSCRTTSG